MITPSLLLFHHDSRRGGCPHPPGGATLRKLLASTARPQVKIYFDPETYHHVMTVYTVEITPGMAREITESVYQHENRYTIEERFSEFQPVDGLTLPTHYEG